MLNSLTPGGACFQTPLNCSYVPSARNLVSQAAHAADYERAIISDRCVSEGPKSKFYWGGGACPHTPLAARFCYGENPSNFFLL